MEELDESGVYVTLGVSAPLAKVIVRGRNVSAGTPEPKTWIGANEKRQGNWAASLNRLL
jgi:hypothetical protein